MIGSDFERFVSKDGYPASAAAMKLPDKFEQHVELFDGLGSAGRLHRDNVMLEMCIHPATDRHMFVDNVQRVLRAAQTWIAENFPRYRMNSNVRWENLPFHVQHSPEGKELGCDVDYVVNGMDSVTREEMNADMLLGDRYAGGHLHFSWPDEGIPPWVGAKLCDLFIGIPMIRSLDKRRAQFYGAPTLHRPTKYPDGCRGVEYRVLDSGWTTTEADLTEVAARAEAVDRLLNTGKMALLGQLVGIWDGTLFGVRTPLALIEDNGDLDRASQQAHSLYAEEFGHDPV